MKVQILCFLAVYCYQFASAQSFTLSADTPFSEVTVSRFDLADVDNDNDLDLVLSGKHFDELEPRTELYINDGNGTFVQDTDAEFISVSDGSVDFADVDNDGDQDVLIAGVNLAFNYKVTKLYRNDGDGNFTLDAFTPFEGVKDGYAIFADVDGDNDQDVLVAGGIGDYLFISFTQLYLNDGTGFFTESQSNSIVELQNGGGAFNDIDGDNDLDLLVTGIDYTNNIRAILYANDGSGNFTEVTDTPFEGAYAGEVAFADIDNDGDDDLLVTGRTGAFQNESNLYVNDGNGNFTDSGVPLIGVISSAAAFADVDADDDLDLFICGANGFPTSDLYLNDGTGHYDILLESDFIGISRGDVAFADIDGDQDMDLLLTGRDIDPEPRALLYWNDTETFIGNIIEESALELTLNPNIISSTSKHEISLNVNSKEFALATISIFDLQGQMLINRKEQLRIGEQSISLEVSELGVGTYFVQVEEGQNKAARKFVVQ